ncbi:MAG TPA: hypothetical protein VN734_14165 [Acidobacteriaceae bacterium]|nr:hypothetical protein [Acidobacteriaceae bacterium]
MIVVKDETAGVVILTIDSNGNIAFGDGTPVNRLTLDGYGIIDDNGHIIHGATSSTVTPTEGTVNVPFQQQATITTLAGRTPLVQIATKVPTQHYYVQPGEQNPDGSGPDTPEESTSFSPVHSCTPDVGLFEITNNTTATDDFVAEFGHVIPSFSPCGYRWL